MAHAAYFKIYAKFEDNHTFFLGEVYANDGQEYTAKKELAAESGQTLTQFFEELKSQYGVKSLVARKEACLCAECIK